MRSPASLDFDVTGIDDETTKSVLQRIRDFHRDFPFFRGDWIFFTYTFTQAEDNKKIPHNLTFTPTDILQTAIIGDAAIIWNIDKFDKTNLDVTISSPCIVRAFIGRMNT